MDHQSIVLNDEVVGAPEWNVRVGVDVAFSSIVAESIDAFGDLYLESSFTERELRDSLNLDGTWDMYRLTARLATKESVVRALGFTGAAPTEIEMIEDAAGTPQVHLSGATSRHARRLAIESIAVDISHNGDCIGATSIAVVSADGVDDTRFPSRNRWAQRLTEGALRATRARCAQRATSRRSAVLLGGARRP